MAWVLLLYYHLLREGGITNDQTVYIDSEQFNAFDYINVSVSIDQQSEVDQQLLRQGAVVCLLCELNDMVNDFEEDYLAQPFTQKILKALAGAEIAIPEAADIVRAVTVGESNLDFAELQSMLRRVFENYVVQKIRGLGTAFNES